MAGAWNVAVDLLRRQNGLNWHPRTFQMRASGSKQFVQRFELDHKLEHHAGCVNALHFNEAGTLLASGSDDLKIVLWDWMTKKSKIVIPTEHWANIFQAKFMPFWSDNVIVSAARDGQILKISLAYDGSVRESAKVATHRGAAHKLGLIEGDPHVFLSCGEDAVVFNIDLRKEDPHKLVTVKENGERGGRKKVALYTISCDPSNPCLFAAAGRDQFARIYDRRKLDAENSEPVVKFCPHNLQSSESHFENITCLVYSNNGTELLCSYNDENIYLFDTSHSTGAEHIKSYRGHRNSATVKGVNFYGPSSEFIVSGSDCGHVFLWDKETEEIVQFLEADEAGVVNCLEPHPFGAFLATSGLDHDVKIWMPTAQNPTTLDGLEECIEKNDSERENARQMPDEPIPEHIMRMLMRQFMRRQRGDDEDVSESDSDDLDEDESDEDEDQPRRVVCRQS